MKRINYLFLTATMLSFAACSNDEGTNNDNNLVEARITASASRAIDDKWEADAIAVTVASSPVSNMKDMYKNVKYTTTSTGTTAEFVAEQNNSIYFQDADETVTFTAYGTYNDPNSEGDILFSTENQNTAETRKAVDFIYASGVRASKSSPTVNFMFKHIMSRLVLKVTAGNGISASDITSGQYFLNGIELNGKFNANTGAAQAITSSANQNQQQYSLNDKVQITPNEADKRTFTVICFPFDYSNKPLEFIATVNGQNYKLNLSLNLEGGKNYTYNIKVNKTDVEISGSTIAPWTNGGTTAGDATL